MKPSAFLFSPFTRLCFCSSFAFQLACATALPDDPIEGGDGGETAVEPGNPMTDAGGPTDPSDPGSQPEVDAGTDSGGGENGDAGSEPPPPPPPPEEPLFDGNFSGSSNWNGQNRLWALVYRAPGAGGHDHVVRSPNFSGSLTYRVGDLSACSVTVRVPVASLINDENEMRAQLGLADVSGDWGWNLGGGADAVNNNMLSAGQLDAAGHPNITFNSTGCRGSSGPSATVLVDGEMTLKGVTRPVTWSVNLTASAGRVTAKGTLSIRQSDFGITPYSLLNFKNDDEVDLEFDIVVTD